MEAATAVKPTAKQSQVLGLLAESKTVAQIAKRMKISPNGVYGHVRRLKELGLLTEEGKVVTASESPRADGNGSRNGSSPESEALSQVEKILSEAARVAALREEGIDERISEIDRITNDLNGERGQLIAEREALSERLSKPANV